MFVNHGVSMVPDIPREAAPKSVRRLKAYVPQRQVGDTAHPFAADFGLWRRWRRQFDARADADSLPRPNANVEHADALTHTRANTESVSDANPDATANAAPLAAADPRGHGREYQPERHIADRDIHEQRRECCRTLLFG